MSSPSLLCTVQALYTFESSDPSSLRFEEGDFIDVLSKLSSGWWDGWCNGQRGWFPSNYVKIIKEYDGNTGSMRNQHSLFDDNVGESSSSLNNKLPPNWIIRPASDGTHRYFNTATGEIRTVWRSDESPNYGCDVSEDDNSANSTVESYLKPEPVFTPGERQQNKDSIGTTYFSSSTEQQPNEPNHHSTHMHQDILDWNQMATHIAFCIDQLTVAAENGQRTSYNRLASIIVNAVRQMLVSSGTISRESVFLKSDHTLRSHHRAMMATMSKLVLSAQLCSETSLASDIKKLLLDCHELSTAMRHFVKTCQNTPLEIKNMQPFLLSSRDEKSDTWKKILQKQQSINSVSGSTIDQGVRAQYDLRSELAENLHVYSVSMSESIESLVNGLQQHQSDDSRASLAVLLFTQYRNFSSQNGQFLSIVEDIDFRSVKSSVLIKHIQTEKQTLYDNLGQLFFKLQAMTDENIPMEETAKGIKDTSYTIISSVKTICSHINQLVTECNQLDAIQANSTRRASKSSVGSLDLASVHGLNQPRVSISSDQSSTHSKRSRSLTMDTPRKEQLKTIYRASAPVSDLSLFQEIDLKRSHTIDSKHSNAKLKQFFGDDAPESSTQPGTPTSAHTELGYVTGAQPNVPMSSNISITDPQEREQQILAYDYNPNEIVFSVDGSVKGGTLKALVERMTLHDYLDMNFNSTFLLTYRSFCTSLQVIELLERRYNIEPPPNLSPEELELWTTKKQKLIRLRVFNLFKIWLEQYYYEEDSVVLDRLLLFTNTTLKETLSFSALQLERLIYKRKEACKDLKKLVMTHQPDAPEPILPRNLKRFRLLDLDPIELSRQLTLMDFKLYSSIKPVECLDKAWSRDNKLEEGGTPVAANIQASINYCNMVTTWVSDEILSQPEVKKRSALIKYWVNVAERCRQLNSFNTCMAILSAFDNSAVGRLKRTWELVGARTNQTVSQIRKLMGANRNFTQYRALIHSINPPCIPFLGIYLQDLTFIEDGNPNYLKTSKHLINFAKRYKTAEVIREIQQYQTTTYHFRPIEEIQTFITENLHSARDEDQLYKESLRLEPKERDDEKITRLLQESGFL
ncbi:ras guanine nucleotide exchange factor domain-containing protein [Blakeslea trispora]|nr:ras guanine nucleotide exchange factor domain-containing protein [Blakeslea trispora]